VETPPAVAPWTLVREFMSTSRMPVESGTTVCARDPAVQADTRRAYPCKPFLKASAVSGWKNVESGSGEGCTADARYLATGLFASWAMYLARRIHRMP
jgi:hypothetical protein